MAPFILVFIDFKQISVSSVHSRRRIVPRDEVEEIIRARSQKVRGRKFGYIYIFFLKAMADHSGILMSPVTSSK